MSLRFVDHFPTHSEKGRQRLLALQQLHSIFLSGDIEEERKHEALRYVQLLCQWTEAVLRQEKVLCKGSSFTVAFKWLGFRCDCILAPCVVHCINLAQHLIQWSLQGCDDDDEKRESATAVEDDIGIQERVVARHREWVKYTKAVCGCLAYVNRRALPLWLDFDEERMCSRQHPVHLRHVLQALCMWHIAMERWVPLLRDLDEDPETKDFVSDPMVLAKTEASKIKTYRAVSQLFMQAKKEMNQVPSMLLLSWGTTSKPLSLKHDYCSKSLSLKCPSEMGRGFFKRLKSKNKSGTVSWRTKTNWLLTLKCAWLVSWGSYLELRCNYGGAIVCWRIACKNGSPVMDLEQLEASNNASYHEPIPEDAASVCTELVQMGTCMAQEVKPVNWEDEEKEIPALLKIFAF